MESQQTLELFIHRHAQKPTRVSADTAQRLRDVLSTAGAASVDEFIFVGECAQSLEASDPTADSADTHPPVDQDLTLADLEIHNHEHIHCDRCRHISVAVNFSSDTVDHTFSPATTIAVVTTWAKKRLKLDDAASANLVLQLCGTSNRPRPTEHVGEVVKTDQCELCFDLVPEVTPQG